MILDCLNRTGVKSKVRLIKDRYVVLRDVVLLYLINEDGLRDIDIFPFVLIVLKQFVKDDLYFFYE